MKLAKEAMTSINVAEALFQSGSSLTNAAALLWQLDTNRLDPFKAYQLDLQVNTRGKFYTSASQRLFKFWSGAIWQRPTFKAFRNLLGRFDQRSISLDTLDEEVEFIRLICKTNCIRFVHEWLMREQYIPRCDMKGFSELLGGMWFTDHAVNARKATGFEHVFCGEIKRSGRRERLSGLHNYVRVFLEEEFGNLRYIGYVDKGGGMEGGEAMVTIRFELHGHEKYVSSMFFGVSPEFEFGLYTMLGLAGVGNVVVKYGRCRVNVKVVTKGKKILTAYPCLLEVENREGEACRKRRRLEFGVIDLTGNEIKMDNVGVVDLTEDTAGVVDLTEDDEKEERKNGIEAKGEGENGVEANREREIGTEANGEREDVAESVKEENRAEAVGEVGGRTESDGPGGNVVQTVGPVKSGAEEQCWDEVEASELEQNGDEADGDAEKDVEANAQGDFDGAKEKTLEKDVT